MFSMPQNTAKTQQVPVYREILWMLTELGVVMVLVLLGARLASLSVMLSTE